MQDYTVDPVDIIKKHRAHPEQWNDLPSDERAALVKAGFSQTIWQDAMFGGAKDVSGTLQDPAVWISIIVSGGISGVGESASWQTLAVFLRSSICATLIGAGSASAGAGADAGQGFSSFRALKAYLGDPGEGMDWHHIVEQNQINNSDFSVEQIQNTNNVIAVEKTVHAQISGYYSSIQPFTDGIRVRYWLNGQSYSEQFEFGLQVLKDFGVIK